ncbi:hypothetical protein [Piscinibacter sp.]|uniref:hypothetical protein n=1 Tax=Piscinibacter sp. TaxID=1903157 RepID=UPI0039E52D55
MTQTFNVGSRSLFVTTVAWVFIVLALLAVAAAVVRNAEVASLLPLPQGHAAAQPPLTGLLLAYLPWVLGAALALSLATLASAIGLLLRLDWARRAFIGLLVLAIVANLLGLWFQHEVVQSVVEGTLSRTPLPEQALGVFGGFVTAARAMGAAMTLLCCALLGWIIRRLMSAAVRQEFA